MSPLRLLAIGVLVTQVLGALTHWWLAYALGPVVEERLAAGCFEWCGLDRFVHQLVGGVTLFVAAAWSPWVIRAPGHRGLAWFDAIGSVVGLIVLALLATTVGAVAAWALAGLVATASMARGMWVLRATRSGAPAKPS